MEIKEYTKSSGFTVVWEASKCIHAGVCVKKLPQVYKPKDKPWISPDLASNQELINQIDSCPSGALTYYLNGDKT